MKALLNGVFAIINIPKGLNQRTGLATIKFCEALLRKLFVAQTKYGYSDDWLRNEWQNNCRLQLVHHVQKGDPLDVAAYAMFCFIRGWSTAEQGQTAQKLSRPISARVQKQVDYTPDQSERLFCDRLRIMREQKNLTQQQLGTLLSSGKVKICEIEGGNTRPTLQFALKAARVLDCDPIWLLGLKD